VTDTDLAHHGVKGMKWGVRKSDVGTDIRLTKAQAKRAAVTAGKVAFAVTRYGIVPAAAATGTVALPVAGGVGVGLALAADPNVHKAVRSSAAYSKVVMDEAGKTSMRGLKKFEGRFTVDNVLRQVHRRR
jgi:hypothetical protein